MPMVNMVFRSDSEGLFSLAEPLSCLLKLDRDDAFSHRFVKSILAAYHVQITNVSENITFSSQDDVKDHGNITALHEQSLFNHRHARSVFLRMQSCERSVRL